MSQLETKFDFIVPSRYVTFTIGNPFPLPYPPALNSPNLRVSVIDSPSASNTSKDLAVILVPPNRESDWVFSTEAGLLQLILASDDISRLIAISVDSPNSHCPTSFKPLAGPLELNLSQIEENLESLLLSLSPNSLLLDLPVHGSMASLIPFLNYEDRVKRTSVLEIRTGPCVGEMLIEDVELTSLDNSNGREFRRRLRFKRMPNYIQTQIRIISDSGSDLNDEMENINFNIDNNGLLVQPYLSPMVAGLAVISSYLSSRIQSGLYPRTLCLGLGGGALVTFLSTQMAFEVVGVEEDAEVYDVGRKYFGLANSRPVRVSIQDGIEMMKKFTAIDELDGKYDVIMVDLDSSDIEHVPCAPPLEFIQKDVLLGARERICQSGVLILNLIAPNKSFYDNVVSEFLEVFKGLYEIDAGNEENMILIASVSETQTFSGHEDNIFLNKLKSVVHESYILSIRKIQRTGHQ